MQRAAASIASARRQLGGRYARRRQPRRRVALQIFRGLPMGRRSLLVAELGLLCCLAALGQPSKAEGQQGLQDRLLEVKDVRPCCCSHTIRLQLVLDSHCCCR